MSDGTGGQDRVRRLGKAALGIGVFVGVGLLLAPGLARREPGPALRAPGADAPAAQPPSQGGIRLDLPAAGGVPATAPGGAPAADADAGPRAFDCMIVPSEVVDVGSAITGVLEEVVVERGDYVEAGQVVAKLEASVEAAAVRVALARANRTDDLESSRTQLALSQKRLARAQELFDRDVLSLDTRQEVEAKAELAALELARAEEDRRLARLQLEQARANLERRTIRSPVAGVVIERMLSRGEVVDEETVLRIARVDPLRVEAILPADWFGRTRTGDRAEVVPEAPLDQAQSARVAIVDPVLDGASGTFGVQLDLPNPERQLPAGLRCQVRFLGRPAGLAWRPERPPSLRGLRWEPQLPAVAADRAPAASPAPQGAEGASAPGS